MQLNANQETTTQQVYDTKEDEFQNQIAVQLNLPTLATNNGMWNCLYCETIFRNNLFLNRCTSYIKYKSCRSGETLLNST